MSRDQPSADAEIEALQLAAEDPALREDHALALLKHADLLGHVIEALSKNPGITDSRRVKLKIVMHPRTPRRLSLSLLRKLYTFDLMQAARTPGVPGDVQRAAEDMLIRKLESLTLGERISLARRSSGRVAAALLAAQPRRVLEIALGNPRLTEALVISALRRPGLLPEAAAELATALTANEKWMHRREVRCLVESVSSPELDRTSGSR
jgi:hypothetical protein